MDVRRCCGFGEQAQVLTVENLLKRHIVVCATNGLGLSPEFAEMSCAAMKQLVDATLCCEYILPVTKQCDNAVTGTQLFRKLRGCHTCVCQCL